MRPDYYPLEVKLSSAAGRAQGCKDYINKWVSVVEAAGGAITATYNVEVSPDGVTWFVVQQVVNGAALVEVAQTIQFVRINTISWAVGTLVGQLGAILPREC